VSLAALRARGCAVDRELTSDEPQAHSPGHLLRRQIIKGGRVEGLRAACADELCPSCDSARRKSSTAVVRRCLYTRAVNRFGRSHRRADGNRSSVGKRRGHRRSILGVLNPLFERSLQQTKVPRVDRGALRSFRQLLRKAEERSSAERCHRRSGSNQGQIVSVLFSPGGRSSPRGTDQCLNPSRRRIRHVSVAAADHITVRPHDVHLWRRAGQAPAFVVLKHRLDQLIELPTIGAQARPLCKAASLSADAEASNHREVQTSSLRTSDVVYPDPRGARCRARESHRNLVFGWPLRA
jgi:hypothetical protein